MKWIVDVDGRATTIGAIRFAAALARGGASREDARFVPVHVLGDEHLRAMLRMHHLDEVVDTERELARRAVRQAAPQAFGDVEVVQAVDEAMGLAGVQEAERADGLIVPRGDAHLLRLRGVARRLVRRPPCPVVVVPADANPAPPDGPVVALTALDPGSVDAWLFAARLARETGRQAVALHVAEGEGDVREEHVLAWTAGAGIRADRAAVRRGGIVEEAIALADGAGALMLVAGWHAHQGLRGVLGRDVARTLAARASRPVAIVPSRRTDAVAAARERTAREPLHA